jgi:hypothetical protein
MGTAFRAVQSRADAGFASVVGPALDALPNGRAAPPVIEIPAPAGRDR